MAQIIYLFVCIDFDRDFHRNEHDFFTKKSSIINFM